MSNDERQRLVDRIIRLTEECNWAQREVCWYNEQVTGEPMRKYAERRGWECYKEDGK